MRAKKYMQKALVVTLTSVMLAGTVAPALPVEAATQKSVVVSNEREVLVAGRNYYVQNENATNFKSSNESVASIDETGKITPKKTGYVTISATVDGEKVKTKFMCVSKFGVTASQTKIDKMLEAENVKNISIVTAKDVDYQIAEGDYAKKTLTVKSPNADVDNHGTFKKIKIKDVADNTFRNYKKNKFVITDKKFRFAEKAKGSEITVAEGAVGRLIAQGKDTVIKSSGNLEVKPQGKNVSIAKVEVDGGQIELNLKKLIDAIKEVFVQKKADVKISGGKKANLKVTVGKDAKGATINSDSSVDLVVNAEITINLTGAAGGSKIDVADGVKVVINIGSNVDGTVTVGDTEVKAGDKVEVTEDGKVEVNKDTTTDDTTTGGSTGGGSGSGGGSSQGTTLAIKPSVSGTTTTYTLTGANSFEELSSVTVDITTASGTKKVTVNNGDKLKAWKAKANTQLATSETKKQAVANWKAVEKKIYEYDNSTMTVEGAGYTKTVTVTENGNTYTAKVTMSLENDVITANVEYVSGDMAGQTMLVKASKADEITIVKNNVNYVIGTNTITVTGKDTTKNLVFSSVTKN